MYDPVKEGAHCHLCPLKGQKPTPPTPAKDGKLRLVVVSEECQRADEKFGYFLPGGSLTGRLVRGNLAKAGISPDEIHWTAACLCRPENDKDAKKAAECCAPRLLREVSQLPIEVPALTLGRWATFALTGFSKLLYARGFIWRVTAPKLKAIKVAEKCAKNSTAELIAKKRLKGETLRWRRRNRARVVFPSLGPTFAARADTWAPILSLDVARVGRFLRGGITTTEETAPFRVWPGAPPKRGSLRAQLAKLGPIVGCDIETDGVKPHECGMLCLGLSDGVRSLVIWPWKPEYAKPLAKWLKTRKTVVLHNGVMFDLPVMRRHGVVW